MSSDEATRLGKDAARRLARIGCCMIAPGLTGSEFARFERDYGFEFAADHRAFLAAGLPLTLPPAAGQVWSEPWPDWRDGSPADLRRQLNWPIEGMLFDVEHNAVWHRSWGQRPADISDALRIARQHLAQAPKMIPAHQHRLDATADGLVLERLPLTHEAQAPGQCDTATGSDAESARPPPVPAGGWCRTPPVQIRPPRPHSRRSRPAGR